MELTSEIRSLFWSNKRGQLCEEFAIQVGGSHAKGMKTGFHDLEPSYPAIPTGLLIFEHILVVHWSTYQ